MYLLFFIDSRKSWNLQRELKCFKIIIIITSDIREQKSVNHSTQMSVAFILDSLVLNQSIIRLNCLRSHTTTTTTLRTVQNICLSSFSNLMIFQRALPSNKHCNQNTKNSKSTLTALSIKYPDTHSAVHVQDCH